MNCQLPFEVPDVVTNEYALHADAPCTATYEAAPGCCSYHWHAKFAAFVPPTMLEVRVTVFPGITSFAPADMLASSIGYTLTPSPPPSRVESFTDSGIIELSVTKALNSHVPMGVFAFVTNMYCEPVAPDIGFQLLVLPDCSYHWKANGTVPPPTVAVSTDIWPWSIVERPEVIGFSDNGGFTFTTDVLAAVSAGVPADVSPTTKETIYPFPIVVPVTAHVLLVDVHPELIVNPEGTVHVYEYGGVPVPSVTVATYL